MKLERLPEYVTTAFAMVVGIGIAVLAGSWVGSGLTSRVGMVVAGIIAITLCVGLRSKIWLFIPLCWSMTGVIPITDVPLAVRDIAVLLAFGSFLVLVALKIVRVPPRYGLLDVLLIANVAYVALVFARNPAGLRVFGSEMVGGRPYFDILIAFLAYRVIDRVPVDLSMLKRIPIIIVLGSAIISGGAMIATLFPFSAGTLGQIYSGFAVGGSNSALDAIDPGMIRRLMPLKAVGSVGLLLLCSYYRPLTLLWPFRHPGRFLAGFGSTVAILLSGFRSELIGASLIAAASTYFRRQSKDLVLFAIIGLVAVAFLAMGNGVVFHVPKSIQRTLSFLPGNWDNDVGTDATGSKEWRFEMWRIVLTDDKYIHDKLLGDGFGLSMRDLAIIESSAGFLGAAQQEAFMLTGVFHSGPLSAIRYVGGIGLALFISLLLYTGKIAYGLIGRARGSELFPVALFIGMGLCTGPIFFLFIYGAYDSDLPNLINSVALLKYFEKGLNVSLAREKLDKQNSGAIPLPYELAGARGIGIAAGMRGKQMPV